MQVFYAPDISSDYYTLSEGESKHIVRVLRMKKDAPVRLIDGKGSLYEGVIDKPDASCCGIRISSVVHDFEKRGYYLHIAISPLKNPERYEWFVEKSVEIGIDEITPLLCHNTEKTGIKEDRIRNIIISAMKQSLKARTAKLNVAADFRTFIEKTGPEIKLIAHCTDRFHRQGIKEACPAGSNAVILIGPEGDFTPEEIILASENGYKAVHLGKSRLRTETAGIAACHSVYFINQ